MKKAIFLQALILTSLVVPTIAFAQQSGGVSQIQTFIQSVIQVFITFAS